MGLRTESTDLGESSETRTGPEVAHGSQHDEEESSSSLKVHGFENELISLEKMLKRRQSDTEFKAIGIVGVLGVGKSTLCRALLNKPEVKTSFLPRIWVRMSGKPSGSENSKEAVVKTILKCLGVDEEVINSISSDHGLHGLLYAMHLQLTGKKYLIVLDDVGSSDEWYGQLDAPITRSGKWDERLAYGLPKGYGGTVIVTSRIDEVAKKMVGKKNIHVLLPLSNPENCWSIFTDTLKREKQKLVDLPDMDLSNLEQPKKELFLKCAGLPFAAKMMGKTMSEKLKEAARELQEGATRSEIETMPENLQEAAARELQEGATRNEIETMPENLQEAAKKLQEGATINEIETIPENLQAAAARKREEVARRRLIETMPEKLEEEAAIKRQERATRSDIDEEE